MDHECTRTHTPTLGLAAIAVATTLVAATPAAVGQSSAFDPLGIGVVLTGSEVSPAVTTPAVGECSGYIDPAAGVLGLTCSSTVDNAGSLVLVTGRPGAGSVLANLGQGQVVSDELVLLDDDVAAILTGQVWVAVTSPSEPAGEIAARLLPRPTSGEQIMLFPLREDSLVYSGSSALGSCALRVGDGGSQIELLCTHDVANARELRVIVDGGIVQTVDDVASPFEATLPSIAASFDRFLDGKFGVVLTSSAFPDGEIGMVLDRCIESPNTLCLNSRRFRVTVDFTAPGGAAAAASAVPARSADSGMFSFFDPANWEVLIKVLNACGINQKYWVFLSANTDVAFTVTVYDTLTGRRQTYSNPPGTLASPVADTNGVFSCS